jgi:hypothetical protein
MKSSISKGWIGIGLILAATAAAHASGPVMSPRGRALAEDFRKVSTPTTEALARGTSVGTPRGLANVTRTVRGTTEERLDRAVALGSPRGRASFPGIDNSRWDGRERAVVRR